MDLDKDWNLIKDIFKSGISSSKHCSIGSVASDGKPHITPIGFVFLRDDKTAYYFEKYSQRLPANYRANKNICLMAVNSSFNFWFKSLYKGRFIAYPGVRLYGEVGELRQANAAELRELKGRIGIAKYLKGSKLIWSDLNSVRDIKLTSVEPIKYPKMMEHFF